MKCLLIVITGMVAAQLFGQSLPVQKEVMILGTFHFVSNADRIKTDKEDMLTAERQKEIEAVTNMLAEFKPDKIFIEWDPETDQGYVDSAYAEYIAGRFKLRRNEVYQLGFRLAGKLGHKTVYCIDAQGWFLHDTLVATAERYGQVEKFKSYGDSLKRIVYAGDSLQKSMTIQQILSASNTKEAMQFGLAVNNVFIAPELGPPGNYAGAEFVGEWYKRNIRMYSNLIRQTDDHDQRVLLIVGSSHKPVIQHLFETNPKWKIVEVNDYLK